MKRVLAAAAFFGAAASALGQEPSEAAFKETLRAPLDPALPPYQPNASVAGQIRSVGEDYMQKLLRLWIDGFTRMQPKAQFTVEAKGSKSAPPALLEGRADIAPMGRELFPDEAAAFETKFGYEAFAVRVAGGTYRTYGKTYATAFLVNKANPIEKLSLDQLDAIYSKTRRRGYEKDLTTWGQLGLRGEWAKRPITPYGVRRPNGTASHLQWRILKGGEYKDTIKEFPATAPIVFSVAEDPGGIGYARFGQTNPKVKTVALAETQAGPYYEGTFEDVVSHRYPLSRYVYIVLNRPPGKPVDASVKEFLRFVLSKEGQQAVQAEGDYIPLSAEVAKQERARLE